MWVLESFLIMAIFQCTVWYLTRYFLPTDPYVNSRKTQFPVNQRLLSTHLMIIAFAINLLTSHKYLLASEESQTRLD